MNKLLLITLSLFLFTSITNAQIIQNGDFTQAGYDIDGKAIDELSGSSVAVSDDGKTVAIGAPGTLFSSKDSGRVRVYSWLEQDHGWVQLGSDIKGTHQYEGFGKSVAISSDGMIVAVGGSGSVRVYHWNEQDDSWEQLGADIQATVNVSISSNGKVLAIGDPGSTGGVQVYAWRDQDSSWNQLGSTLVGDDKFDFFGESVSISSNGEIVAIGAPRNDGSFTSTGHVRVYKWHIQDSSWNQLGADIEGESFHKNLGGSVALSSDGETLAVGADHQQKGVAVYEWQDQDSNWHKLGAEIIGDMTSSSTRKSVAISSDGKIVAIGNRNADSGRVQVYRWRDQDKSWIQLAVDIDGEAANDKFGWAVSMSPDAKNLAVGAANNDGNGQNAGHVRVYKLDERVHVYESIVACGSHTAYGQTFISSGTYKGVFNTDSVYVLSLTIRPVPAKQNLSVENTIVCFDDSATLKLASSDSNAVYYLWNTTENKLIAGPEYGTGNELSLQTGRLDSHASFEVEGALLEDNAYTFNGLDQYISIADDDSLHFVDQFTIDCMIKVDDDADARWYAILGKDSYDAGSGFLLFQEGNDVVFSVGSGSWNNIYAPIQKEKWHHITAMYDQGVIRLYVNGKLEASQVVSGFSNALLDMLIGARNMNDGNGVTDHFKGDIGQLRLWNIALDSAAIVHLQDECFDSSEQGLVGLWKMNNKTNEVLDESKHGHVGQFNNMDSLQLVSAEGGCVSEGCRIKMNQAVSVQVANSRVEVLNSIHLVAQQDSATYQWIDCDNDYSEIAGETNQLFTPESNGNYAVIVSWKDCTDTSDCYNMSTAGISTNIPIQYSLYPNPNAGQFTISWEGLPGQTAKLTMYNSLGQEVHMEEVTQHQIIDLKGLPQGTYYVLLKVDQVNSYQRVVVQ